MESNFLTAVFLPAVLFIIMLGMGLGLKTADFRRIAVDPKAVIIGLVAQLVMLPAVGFLLASVFPLSPELAVGVMILAACPGGPTSAVLSSTDYFRPAAKRAGKCANFLLAGWLGDANFKRCHNDAGLCDRRTCQTRCQKRRRDYLRSGHSKWNLGDRSGQRPNAAEQSNHGHSGCYLCTIDVCNRCDLCVLGPAKLSQQPHPRCRLVTRFLEFRA